MKTRLTGFLLAVVLLCGGSLWATDLQSSYFDTERQRIRYGLANSAAFDAADDEFSDVTAANAEQEASDLKPKSPAKAFFLSLAVPGLGQYYYGNRWKPVVFLGVEAVSWILYFKWEGDGDDLTAEFEEYNRVHWSRSDYEDKYLYWVYGVNDDGDVPSEFKEISHHLPDTETQQYFEMTGKYDQFVWGWDDATMADGRTIADFSEMLPMPRVFWQDSIPYSANRMTYETMRNNANSKYDDADKMVIVALVNHLLSAFEAYFATRHHNRQIAQQDNVFSRVEVRARLKSVYTKRDTPYLQFSLRF